MGYFEWCTSTEPWRLRLSASPRALAAPRNSLALKLALKGHHYIARGNAPGTVIFVPPEPCKGETTNQTLPLVPKLCFGTS
ncbi:hypothetical protein SAMN05421753_104278 [Planctomicrobium piriforme]|uniref:Uncharacterized protein n=1 Tax=Planctomicrobium piriforme TaxID=1576369 RepID=A0A1I3ELJ1_9PLAN|nr:hypothetical protein SAMN05421753_104278 [Planctomicrobium piriforme]